MPHFELVRSFWDKFSANWTPFTPQNQPYLMRYHEDFVENQGHGTVHNYYENLDEF